MRQPPPRIQKTSLIFFGTPVVHPDKRFLSSTDTSRFYKPPANISQLSQSMHGGVFVLWTNDTAAGAIAAEYAIELARKFYGAVLPTNRLQSAYNTTQVPFTVFSLVYNKTANKKDLADSVRCTYGTKTLLVVAKKGMRLPPSVGPSSYVSIDFDGGDFATQVPYIAMNFEIC